MELCVYPGYQLAGNVARYKFAPSAPGTELIPRLDPSSGHRNLHMSNAAIVVKYLQPF